MFLLTKASTVMSRTLLRIVLTRWTIFQPDESDRIIDQTASSLPIPTTYTDFLHIILIIILKACFLVRALSTASFSDPSHILVSSISLHSFAPREQKPGGRFTYILHCNSRLLHALFHSTRISYFAVRNNSTWSTWSVSR